MKTLTIILASALAVGATPALSQARPAAAPTAVQTAAAGDAALTLRVCNRSGHDASVAVSYIAVGESGFTNHGWYDVANGACSDVGTTDNANFYFYADATDGSGRSWQGVHPLCVQYPGPFALRSTASPRCAANQEEKTFVALRSTESGAYTWTLNP